VSIVNVVMPIVYGKCVSMVKVMSVITPNVIMLRVVAPFLNLTPSLADVAGRLAHRGGRERTPADGERRSHRRCFDQESR
jgi:hypothetical protein